MAEWTHDLIVNHEALDGQHAEIFRRLTILARALDGPKDALGEAVAALSDAIVTHLASEEAIMDEALYPERVRHRSAHELFMADFVRMRDLLEAAGPSAQVHDWITRRIPDWLRFHITVNDLPLGEFLARRRARSPDGRQPPDGSRRPS